MRRNAFSNENETNSFRGYMHPPQGISLKIGKSTRGLGKELGVSHGGHDNNSNGAGKGEEQPDHGQSAVSFLERSDGSKTDGGGDSNTASKKETCDVTK